MTELELMMAARLRNQFPTPRTEEPTAGLFMTELPSNSVQVTYDQGDERLSKLISASPDPEAVHRFIIEYALGSTIRFAVRRIWVLDASAKIHGFLHDRSSKLFLIVNSERSSEDYETIFGKVYEGLVGRNRTDFLEVLGFIHHPTKDTPKDLK